MKNLIKVVLISSLAVNLSAKQANPSTQMPVNPSAQNQNNSPEDLINECAKGNTQACSIIIDNDPQLAEIKKQLLEDEWLEEERLGIALRVHYLAYQRAKDAADKNMSQKKGEKFVKQVLRTEMYKK